jgi:hypothetical protein
MAQEVETEVRAAVAAIPLQDMVLVATVVLTEETAVNPLEGIDPETVPTEEPGRAHQLYALSTARSTPAVVAGQVPEHGVTVLVVRAVAEAQEAQVHREEQIQEAEAEEENRPPTEPVSEAQAVRE